MTMGSPPYDSSSREGGGWKGMDTQVSSRTQLSVHNLVHRPLVVLPLSAFVSDDTMVTTVLILAGLAGLWRVERGVGSRRVLLVAVLAHVAITYLTEGAIAVRVALGALPPDALRLVDVGPSYVVVPLLAAAALLPPPRAAAGSAVVLLVLAPRLLSGLPAGDVAAVGHLLGMALGVLIGVGWRAWPPHHRPR